MVKCKSYDGDQSYDHHDLHTWTSAGDEVVLIYNSGMISACQVVDHDYDYDYHDHEYDDHDYDHGYDYDDHDHDHDTHLDMRR